MDLSMALSKPACVYFLVYVFVCLSLLQHCSAACVYVRVCVLSEFIWEAASVLYTRSVRLC